MTKYFETISRGKTPQNDKVVIDVDEYGEDPVREWICLGVQLSYRHVSLEEK